jgi:SOS-response transcriptional repressor LexA/DNA-binding transcriptional regulator YiaG
MQTYDNTDKKITFLSDVEREFSSKSNLHKAHENLYTIIAKENSGKAIKEMRKEILKMSRKDFCKITFLAETTLTNLETGRALLTHANLMEANMRFNTWAKENDPSIKENAFALVALCTLKPNEIREERNRFTHSMGVFDLARKTGQMLSSNFVESSEMEKLYSTYQKLSLTDRAKIMERMEYIISTYEDESAIPTKRIALLGQTACGNPIEAIAIADEFIETNDLRATFALRAVGDSMAPIINDGDIILIKQIEELEINDIGIFQINESGFSDDEEVTCKRYSSVTADGVITLSPLNAAYEPIVVDSKKEQIKIIGKYLGKA